MRDVVILGVAMTSCGKFADRSLVDMVRTSVTDALADAGIKKEQLEASYSGHLLAPWDFHEEQILNFSGIVGQEVLKQIGIQSIPIHNTRCGCATGGAAFQLGYLDVASGFHDCVLVEAAEKGTIPDRELYVRLMNPPIPKGEKLERKWSGPLDGMAASARATMAELGLTKRHLAWVCSKNHNNASLNPLAQYRQPYTIEDVLADKLIVEPLHRCMCAPNGDGGGAAILCSKEFARKYTTKPITVATSVVGSRAFGGESISGAVAREAQKRAGVAPSDLQVIELPDATAWAEIQAYWEIGLCKREDVADFIDRKESAITGKYPCNTSGGMESRGEPFGATGVLQIAEVIWQMRGKCGQRQVAGPPKIAFSQISGEGGCAAAIFKS